MFSMRIGHGYDVHRLTEGRKLYLGGVEIPYDLGLLGHSDADVAIHALLDALLGAVALGDIGALFPDSHERYRGIRSTELLRRVAELLSEKGYTLGNADITVIAELPKIRPYIDAMRKELASCLVCDISKISVKATTEEGLGFTGEGKGIAAHAVVLLTEK